MRWRRSGLGWEAVHRTTDEKSQGQVGPTILFDRPALVPPIPSSIRFPLWARQRGIYGNMLITLQTLQFHGLTK